MARPRKDPAEQRRHRVSFAVTDEELARLQARARKAGVGSIHAFARRVALDRPGSAAAAEPEASLPFEVVRELRAIGVNLNQQTKRLHIHGDVTPELRRLWARLDRLLSTVIAHGPPRR